MAGVCGRAERGEGHCTVVFCECFSLVHEYFIYLLVSCCLLWSQVTATVGGGCHSIGLAAEPQLGHFRSPVLGGRET